MLNIDEMPNPVFFPEMATVTADAMKHLDAEMATMLFARHIAGDSGDMTDAAKAESQKALKEGQTFISIFQVYMGPAFLIMTDSARTRCMMTLLDHGKDHVRAMLASPAKGSLH